MTAHVLVPFDGSEPAREALETAIDLFPDGEFVVITVVDTSSVPFIPNVADEGETEDDLEAIPGDATEQLAGAESIAADRAASIETSARVGSPAREIVDYAERESIDHVVIGSHGRSGVKRILLGSVAETVVRHSPVPVTVVR